MSEKTKDNSVYLISVSIITLVVLCGLIFPKGFELSANILLKGIVHNFGWFYTFAMTCFVGFAIWIAYFSKYKNMKLGPDDSKPEYSNLSWFAMLFSAGMGIGLVFYGIYEPLYHYVNPIGAESMSVDAAKFAMTKSFLHWGLHPWANYSILGLGLAYMQFRRNKPGLISSLFIPLIGEEKAKGYIGKLIDILAIFATAAGMATSLGLGTYQISSGLNFMFKIPETTLIQIIIVVVITIIYTWTAVTGIDKGIKFISNLNMILVVALLGLSIIFGPTIDILNIFGESTGNYLQSLLSNTFEIGAFSKTDWYGAWTLFYWAWWIAWAPFTGTFIARISKGRTIREFISGVLIVPSLVSFFWFSIFGAIDFAVAKEVLVEASKNASTAFFMVINNITLGNVISVIAIALLFTFFITSANSATFVLGMLSHEGDLNPPNSKKLVWGIIQSALALSLMIGSANGLKMLQTVSIVAAFPFAFIMLLTIVSIMKALKEDDQYNQLK
ncbi:BCCT family transporter [Pseudoleptotrichia goodfellowii]|uniref:Transporter, betaine/carnitine/choline family n=1 Tax=Pseudoleptotrichia goodfellowii TaxID=157692 RepID=A0A510JBU1_9FUSO|nr:BCCT family transporter [Pseudoleptotrichia goodfellowii]BBM35911.1 transporter, betaine/carnitine/choline family [Pseudoleptotrichia goodfellowii]